MAIEITKVTLGARDVIGGQEGAVVPVADDAVSAALSVGTYRIIATTACRVRIGSQADGSPLADATGGETWPANHVEVRNVGAAEVIAVDALA